MKYLKTLFILSIVISCYAQKVYENSNTPKDDKFNIVLKERTVLDFNSCEKAFVSFSLLAPTQLDRDSSLFFVDSRNSKVVKFDKNGRFITSFSNHGNGPGEFPNNFVNVFYLSDDSLYLVNHSERKIIIFETNGKFSHNRTYSRESNPSGKQIFVKNDKTIIYKTFEGMYKDVKRKLVLADISMEIFKNIFSMELEENPAEIMSGKNSFELACSKDEIYMSVPGDFGSYLINVYDFDGNMKYKIRKHYRKVRINNDKFGKTLKQNKISTKGMSDYERPIQSMFCDTKGRLFVRSSKDDDKKSSYFFDVFQKAEFINRVGFEMPSNIDGIAFRNDFAYGFDCNNNSIIVYEYEEVRIK